jgi:hypothetical protein
VPPVEYAKHLFAPSDQRYALFQSFESLTVALAMSFAALRSHFPDRLSRSAMIWSVALAFRRTKGGATLV